MKNITISVVIPTYNRAELIKGTLDSLLEQTVPFDEIIIVDDASCDNTIEVLNKYAKNVANLKILEQKINKGAQAARNRGILESKSDYVLLLDSDNTLCVDYVQKVKSKLESDETVDVLTNFSKIIDETDSFGKESFEWVTEGNILVELLKGDTYVDNSSACIKREKLLAVGLLDENCPSFQEWDTHIRLARYNCKYNYIPEKLTNYLIHSDERISVSTKSVLAKGLYVLIKHKQTWLTKAGHSVYCRYLVHVYDSFKVDGNKKMTFKVFLKIINNYPSVLKQFTKRKIYSWKRIILN